jgi:tetratricopeptide (TPR) repeat protein
VTVTGYDADHEKILAHFSDLPDEAISLSTFSAIWNRSGKWGMVPVPPDRIPATAQRSVWLRAAYDLETTGRSKEALIAYQYGTQRWPDDVPILFALANAQYRAGQMPEAEKVYRKILEMDPSHPYALNNLADLMCQKGRGKEALKLLDRNVSGDEKARSQIEATRQEIRSGCPPRR